MEKTVLERQSEWGPPILSGIILVTFGVLLYVLVAGKVEPNRLADGLLGVLATLAVQVGNYWLGSSAGSARKSETIAAAQVSLANSVPAPPA
jgi:uncharacterized membrane protein (DUF441 family)